MVRLDEILGADTGRAPIKAVENRAVANTRAQGGDGGLERVDDRAARELDPRLRLESELEKPVENEAGVTASVDAQARFSAEEDDVVSSVRRVLRTTESSEWERSQGVLLIVRPQQPTGSRVGYDERAVPVQGFVTQLDVTRSAGWPRQSLPPPVRVEELERNFYHFGWAWSQSTQPDDQQVVVRVKCGDALERRAGARGAAARGERDQLARHPRDVRPAVGAQHAIAVLRRERSADVCAARVELSAERAPQRVIRRSGA